MSNKGENSGYITVADNVLFYSVPDDFKVNPGAVESIAVHAKNPDKVS